MVFVKTAPAQTCHTRTKVSHAPTPDTRSVAATTTAYVGISPFLELLQHRLPCRNSTGLWMDTCTRAVIGGLWRA